MLKTVLRGAAWGAVAWLVYGVVETILSIGIQLWRFREIEVLRWQWPLVGLLLGTYALFGIISGVAGGLLLARRGAEERWQLLAGFTIAAAFAANLIRAWPLARSEQMVLAVAVLLVIALGVQLFAGEWSKRTAFLGGPWTVSFLLLGVPCLSRELLTPQDSSFKKTGLSILLLTVIAALSWFVRHSRTSLAGQSVRVVAVSAVFLIMIAAVQRKTPLKMPAPTAPGTSKPNVLLIVMDTVRADHLSLYGYARETAPHLRKFAREATVYSRAIAASDFTLATHATMFTGLYPDWNGAIQSSSPDPIAQPLGDRNVTLAEVLRSNGYWTVESAANFAFLSPWTGLTRGFAISEFTRPVTLSSEDRPFYLREAARWALDRFIRTAAFDRSTRTAEDVSARAGTILEQAKTSGIPFFLFLNYMDAHTPYTHPFDSRFSNPGDEPVRAARLHDLKLQVISEKRPLAASEQGYLISQYDGGIAEEDSAIGSLVDQLRGLGLYENTLIVITSDHGDAFGEHGLLDHFAGFVYQDLVHVPLLVKYPGQHEAKESDELVSQVDLMPTVLEAVGVASLGPLQGRSLLQPAGDPGSVVFSRGTKASLLGPGIPRLNGLRRAIFSGPWKLITWTAGTPELYDLAADPDEEHDLYTPDDRNAADLSKRLDDWVAAMPRQQPRRTKLDKPSQERLKSLGYVQ
jgi:arylsulfatase A-like enzyme